MMLYLGVAGLIRYYLGVAHSILVLVRLMVGVSLYLKNSAAMVVFLEDSMISVEILQPTGEPKPLVFYFNKLVQQ